MVDQILSCLHLAARHGRLLLILGLVVGITLPSAGVYLRSWLSELVSLLIFVAALRIGHQNAFGALKDLPRISAIAIIYQVVVPLVFLALFSASGLINTPLALAIVVMAAASPISGSPNLTILVGADPAPALHLLVISTLLLPVTIIAVFYWMPLAGSVVTAFSASAKLLVVILSASVLAFLLRSRFLNSPSQSAIEAIDGFSALVMAVLVIGLMSAVGSTLLDRPFEVFQWLAAAFIANFGLQVLAFGVLGPISSPSERIPFAISAGNRNIALFLVALPAESIDAILLFIGCYQIPMYMTPILLRKLYQKRPD